MLNEKAAIILLTVGLIKKTKWVNVLQNKHLLEEEWKFN